MSQEQDEQELYAPPKVREMCADLTRDTGVAPTVELLTGSRRWRVALTSDTVRMTIDFKLTDGGRCVWGSSQLYVGGQRRELAANYQAFVRLFTGGQEHLDQVSALEMLDEAGELPMPAEADPRLAPKPVRTMHQGLVSQFAGRSGMRIRLGRDGEHWVVGADNGRASFRIAYTVRGTHSAGVMLVVDGEDLSGLATANMQEAIARAFKARPDTPSTSPISGASDTTRQNSVETRRATVIRN